MSGARNLEISVSAEGQVTARDVDSGDRSPHGDILRDSLDRELMVHFEGWLAERGRIWREREIRAFGSLLHRFLLPRSVWNWADGQIQAAGESPVRLSLAFPDEGEYAALSSVPWEFLYSPQKGSRSGYYLATRSGLVLTRQVQSSYVKHAHPAPRQALIAVSQPADPLLGEVESEEISSKVTDCLASCGLAVQSYRNLTAVQLSEKIKSHRPQVFHYMGLGKFDLDARAGELALCAEDGGSHWLPDHEVAEILAAERGGPEIVVLHSCEGAVADFSDNFAGLAPQLIRRGVSYVVAMQYAVTNQTATRFSSALYEQLSRGVDIDLAVQGARNQLGSREGGTPRDFGLPVIYARAGQAMSLSHQGAS